MVKADLAFAFIDAKRYVQLQRSVFGTCLVVPRPRAIAERRAEARDATGTPAALEHARSCAGGSIMTGRPSVNKRQREMVRKERQAEKVTRRDERRAKRGLPSVEEPLSPESPAIVDPSASPESPAIE
jgi:hypothetical protein